MTMDQAELTTDQVLNRDIPWETYMTTKLITGTALQLLRRYDKKSESQRASLLDDDGPSYIRVFVSILRDIFKEETVEYVLALIDEMLTANPKRARLLLWKGNWFIQEKSCKILALMISARPKSQHSGAINGEASDSKSKLTTIDDVLKGLVDWLCAQLRNPSHPSRGIPSAVNCLATLLKEPLVRSSFVQADGVKLLIPFINPVSNQTTPLASSQSNQQSMQLLMKPVSASGYCHSTNLQLSTWLLPIACHGWQRLLRVQQRKRVIVMTFKNLLPKGSFGAQMVDLGMPQIVQNLKANAWGDEDLIEALNQLDEGLKYQCQTAEFIDKYKQEDAFFWRENIKNFEDNDFQILRVLITILDTSNDPRSLAVACFDLSQFIQHHPSGRIIVNDLKAKERVMKLMNHENAEVTKNALLCIQRLFLGAKYASFLQA
ncbi:V-type proton ATPase subunit H [Bienertia sinuspersici]